MTALTKTRHSNSDLVDALNSLNVHFLSGGSGATFEAQPETLISGLAESNESRVRLALIPLFLHHPEFCEVVSSVVSTLSQAAQIYLEVFYTAAHLFQQKYENELAVYFGKQLKLPDLFSEKLNILGAEPDKRLDSLAQQHASLSGRSINWLGTYEHAAERTLKRLEHERLCQTSPLQ